MNASEEKLANQIANRKEDGTEKKDKERNVKTTYDKFIQLRIFRKPSKGKFSEWRLETLDEEMSVTL